MKKQSHSKTSGLECTHHLVIYGIGTQRNYNQIHWHINVKNICHCPATGTHTHVPDTRCITFRAAACVQPVTVIL